MHNQPPVRQHVPPVNDAETLQRLIVQQHAALRRAVGRAIEPGLQAFVDPDDVLQDALITAFRKLPQCQFDGPAARYAWLERIVLFTLRDQLRALKRAKRDVHRRAAQHASATTSYPDLFARLTAADSTPSRKVARREAVAAVMASMARLTPDQRTVIQLRVHANLPAAEIAKSLNKSEDAIHALLHRGMKSLRRYLAITASI